jgi:ubiquinone/menaquinone biosynthesis C-methylase UbiE
MEKQETGNQGIEMTKSSEVLRTAFDRPGWYVEGQAFNIRIRVESVKHFSASLLPRDVLDIGCGDGSLSLPFLDQSNRLTFLDRSKGMLDIVSSRVPAEAASRVTLINQDFLEAEGGLGSQTFDVVICVGVMAYVSDRPRFLRAIARLLKPGGTLITECSDAGHFYSRFNSFYEAVRVKLLKGAAFPTIKRSSSELTDLLAKSGFRQEESFRYSLPPHILKRFLSQEGHYKLIRSVFGEAGRNRLGWLGNECLYHYTRT